MNCEESSSREKYETINSLLDGEYILVHLNTRTPGVQIPAYLMTSETVTLKLSRWFRGAMDIHENRITADLLFNNNYFTCVIPFAAVWGVSGENGQNILWPDAIPPEVLKKVLSVPAGPVCTSDDIKKERKRPQLKRVK